jgi:hypothetical protein
VNEHDFQARGLPEEGWKFLVVDGPYGPDGKEALPYHVQSAAQDVFPDAPCRRALDEAVMRHGLGCWEGVKPVKHGRGDEYIWPIRFLTHLPFDRRKKDFSNLLYLCVKYCVCNNLQARSCVVGISAQVMPRGVGEPVCIVRS